MKNVIENLEYQMSTDNEPNDKKSDRLKRTYINASESEKKLIDDVFITICGYSLNTLIKDNEEEANELCYHCEEPKTDINRSYCSDECEDAEYEPDYYEEDDSDYDSGMSHAQQSACDRSDYANEMVQSGEWDEEQAGEFKMGA
ncbi:MAG: hypothetical protein ACTSQA_02125 [Candidatus Heimdallarchaeaceae archaeon]